MTAGEEEPLNLLSFDGGGVRGVMSLVILHQLMLKIKEQHGLAEIPKPCEIFHMIAGTSTGGLIAIMLGRLRMSTAEAISEYDKCAKKIFAVKKKTNLLERFRSTALQETIEDLVRRRNMGELMRDPTNPSKGKAVVCVLPAKQVLRDARRVRSYRTEDNWDKDIKIWEAARATTAATSYFKPQPLTSDSQTESYIDAALGNNNPITHLLKEASEQYGLGRRLGCLISIGTGTRDGQLSRMESGFKQLSQLKKVGSELVDVLKNKATDAEAVHRLLQERFSEHSGAYFRFNVDDAADKAKLNEYQKIDELKKLTAKYVGQPSVATQISLAADALETAAAEHGLTLGHIHKLDPAQIIRAGQKAQLMGEASQYFTGREDVLRKLDSFFSERSSGPYSRRQFCLYGIGGVGKTQIALKAANIFRTNASSPLAAQESAPRASRFKHILYIDGTDPVTISQSYANIARDEFDMGDGDSERLMAKVLRKLAGLTEDWFMIYDNCNQEDRRGLLPVGGTGNILFTTRNRLIRDQMHPGCMHDVPVLDELDASRFLLTASGPEYAELNSWDLSLAQEIVAELGFLPLAIDQAAAYIRAGECRLDGYMTVFQDKKAELLKDPRFRGSLPQNQAVYTTFEASYEAIKAMKRREGLTGSRLAAEYALRVLDLVCFWHNESIPVSVGMRGAELRVDNSESSRANECDLKTLTGRPSMTWDEFFFVHELQPDHVGFIDGLRILERFSIVDFSESGIFVSMHVLVHSWARDRMSDDKRSRQALMSKIFILESIARSSSWLIHRQYQRRLYPHVRSCLGHSSWDSKMIGEVFELELMANYAHLLTTEKRFGEAEKYLGKALHLAKVLHGPESEIVQELLVQFAKMYREMGCFGDAEALLLEAMERLRYEDEVKKEEHMIRARSQLKELKRGRKPKKHPGGVEANKEGTDNPTKELSPGELTSLARSFVPRFGTKDGRSIRLANMEEELAMAYYDQGDIECCQFYLDRAHERRKKVLHPDGIGMWRSTDEIQRKTRLSDVEYWMKRFEAATKHFTDNEEEDFLASDYRLRLSKSVGDSALRRRQKLNHEALDGLYEIAYGYYERIQSSHYETYGENDRRALELTRWMISCLVGMRRGEEAEALARKCLASAIMGYGECHQETILALEQLHHAIVCRLGAPDLEACYAIKDAWIRADALFGEHHRYTRRMERLCMKATDSFQMELSNWQPMGQEALEDPHWKYKASDEDHMRIQLLGPRCNEHIMSYTVPDATYNNMIISSLTDRLKALDKKEGPPQANVMVATTGVGDGLRSLGDGLDQSVPILPSDPAGEVSGTTRGSVDRSLSYEVSQLSKPENTVPSRKGKEVIRY